MKKIFMVFALCLAFVPSMFASVENVEVNYESDKVFGISPGLRFSVLGIEPTLAFDIYNFELETACAFSSGITGEQFGFAPSISFAYDTNPFERGGSASFGVEYMYLTPAYTNMIAKTIDKDADNVLPGIHAVSLFYRGTYNFNKIFGLLWRVRLPMVIAGSKDGESFNLNVTNLPGFGANFLIGVCTISVGVKFMI